MFPPPPIFSRAETNTIGLSIVDGGNVGITGLTSTDVRVALLKHNASSFVGKTLATSDFVEVGNGFYNLSLSAEDLEEIGTLIVKVTPDPGYPGVMKQYTRLAYINNGSLRGGIPQNRVAWIPVLLTLSGTPVGGLLPGDFTVARYREPEGSSFVDLVLDGTNFRELLDLGNPTGVYQVMLTWAALDELGELLLQLEAPTIDGYVFNYAIAKASEHRMFIEVVDKENGNAPLVGATIYLSDITTGLIVTQKVTDAIGQVEMYAPVGEYRLTVAMGTSIFQENNLGIRVVDPNEEIVEAEAAFVQSGNTGPYALQDGDELHIIVNGGELQKIAFRSEDFVPPNVITAVDPDAVAEHLNMAGHSFIADRAGLNNSFLGLRSEQEGAHTSIQVVGGSANTELNFPTEEQVGSDAGPAINSWQLNGARFTPAFPPPATDTVEFTYRVVDLEGKPVDGMEVNIVNKFNPSVRASDGVSSVLGRKVLQFYTDPDGILQDTERGKPRLMKGAVVDIILKGTGIVRSEITVPQTDFTLMDKVEAAEDVFTIQTPNLPEAPRS